MLFSKFDPIPGKIIHPTTRKLFYFMNPIDLVKFLALPRPKSEFLQICPMWYQFGHVPKVQIACALKLKPHLHNDDDL